MLFGFDVNIRSIKLAEDSVKCVFSEITCVSENWSHIDLSLDADVVTLDIQVKIASYKNVLNTSIES